MFSLPALFNHLDAMQWRYATKSYDTTKKIDKEILYALLEILRLTPTTMGLQLWRFVVVTDPELRKQLVTHCSRLHVGHKEHHIESASHLLVFCRPSKFEPALIDQHIEHVAYVRNQSISDLHAYSQNLHHWAETFTDSLETWMDNQTFIALGSFIAACAAARIDSCPIENFSKAGFDEVLNLGEKHLHSVAACSLGVRSPLDKYANEKKVRYPVDDLVIYK
jgi:nitroreductase